MEYRALGRSPLRVSTLSLGCNRIGEDREPDSHWIQLLHRAADLGVTLLDTAETYGKGRSEELIGQALGHRPEITVATKCAGWGPGKDINIKDFSADGMVRSAETSLRKLRRDCLDIFQLHSPTLAVLQKLEWAEGFQRLKAAGKIRFTAVSLDGIADGIWLLDNFPVDAVQLIYNLLHPQAAENLLPRCQQAGVGVLVRMPFQRGILTGKFLPGVPVPAANRASLERERLEPLIERAEAFRGLTASRPGGMAGLAVQYALAHPAVSCLIPGARSLTQLEENIGYGAVPPMSAGEAEAIRRIQALPPHKP
jgi:aryl-alcohol dehydrogenase-like predicted oxidoreductase